ncbi:MAG: hypothetical protein KGS72_12190 [Cyanobacteria bacterium REEB67]|nr:hypothetical protein [Cyanobacteria bacterium REEB67]
MQDVIHDIKRLQIGEPIGIEAAAEAAPRVLSNQHQVNSAESKGEAQRTHELAEILRSASHWTKLLFLSRNSFCLTDEVLAALDGLAHVEQLTVPISSSSICPIALPMPILARSWSKSGVSIPCASLRYQPTCPC